MKIDIDTVYSTPDGKVEVAITGTKSAALGLLLLVAENLAKEIGMDLLTAVHLVLLTAETVDKKVTLQ